MRLTRPAVARLALPEGKSEAIVFDDGLPGFGVRLRAGGKRVWVAQYRIGSKQRRVTIGTVEAIDPDRARARAKEILARVQLGGDPQTEKAEARARAVLTLGAVADRYVAGPAADRLKPRSLAEVERHLKSHWAPLREHAMHKVSRALVAARLVEVASENGPFAANRARASLSALFSWAIREGILDANPVIATNKATAEKSRDRVLSDAEVVRVWQACGGDDYGRIVRLLILTGQRREEVGGMAWSEVDLKAARWSIPAARTKNGLPHEVPLSDPAVDLLTAAPQRGKRDLVFGEGDGPFQGWSRSKMSLDRRIAGAEKGKPIDPKRALSAWRLHDIRRTVATQMADLGVLPHVIEAVLNHVSGHRAGVAGVYNRALYSAEKRAALALWSEHLMAISESVAQ
jgi:integrase